MQTEMLLALQQTVTAPTDMYHACLHSLPFTDSSTHLQACVLLTVQGNHGNCTVATAQGDTIFAVAV